MPGVIGSDVTEMIADPACSNTYTNKTWSELASLNMEEVNVSIYHSHSVAMLTFISAWRRSSFEA